jgi:hypothetical protein
VKASSGKKISPGDEKQSKSTIAVTPPGVFGHAEKNPTYGLARLWPSRPGVEKAPDRVAMPGQNFAFRVFLQVVAAESR